MWCVEGNQGKNSMVTSPLWVSGRLDRLINMHIRCNAYSSEAHQAPLQCWKCIFDTVVKITLLETQFKIWRGNMLYYTSTAG